MEVPGVGPVLASAMVAYGAGPHSLQVGQSSGCLDRACAAAELQWWQGEVGHGITKQGDRYLRQLLVAGALAVIRYAHKHGTKRPWLGAAARPTPRPRSRLSALANKMARMIWAMMMSGERYREPVVACGLASSTGQSLGRAIAM